MIGIRNGKGTWPRENIWVGEVEVIEVVVTGALSTDNMKGPFLNPLNVLLEIFVRIA